ncbi:MAG: 4Fe-4S binding protein [Planctomycetota bacterium]|nr:MAG: 4Fe-4S binding protein [Planctomycetota bacterium]
MTRPPRRLRMGLLWYRRWTAWRRITAIVFLLLLWLGSTDAGAAYFRGSTSGTRIFDLIPLTDPLAAIESFIAARSIDTTALIGAALLIAAALVLGPVFCGWVCPLGLLFDLNSALRRFVRRRVFGIRTIDPMPAQPPQVIKYVLLGCLVGFAAVAAFPLFQIISPINLLVRAAVFGSAAGLAVVVALVVLEWFYPRLWCRALCPLGSLYAIVGRFGLLRVQIDPAEAGKVPCQKCQRTCPMGVPVMTGYTMQGASSVTHPNCTRCGECTQVCPRGVLKLSFFRFSARETSAGRCDRCDHARAAGDISLPLMSGASK